MDRLLNRRNLILGAGATAASVAVVAPAAAGSLPMDREPVSVPADGFHSYMAFEATLLRGGSKPLGVTLDISASAGLASVNIRSLSGTDVMWGAIESNDPIVCDFLGQVVGRIYTESRQAPDFHPLHVGIRPADAPTWLRGHWIQCPDCTAWRESRCETCDDKGCVWETWVNR